MAANPTPFPSSSEQYRLLVLEWDKMAEFSLAVKSINQEFLAIPRHFFFVEYLIFSLLFFFSYIPYYTSEEENLCRIEIHFTPGKKTQDFGLAEWQATIRIRFINKNAVSKSAISPNVSSHSKWLQRRGLGMWDFARCFIINVIARLHVWRMASRLKAKQEPRCPCSTVPVVLVLLAQPGWRL